MFLKKLGEEREVGGMVRTDRLDVEETYEPASHTTSQKDTTGPPGPITNALLVHNNEGSNV